MKNKILIVVIIIFIFVCFYIYKVNKKDNDILSQEDINININIDLDNSDTKIDWNEYETYNITLNESLNIDKEGIYNLTGSISDGNININTAGNVKLILNNVNITNSKGPAIYVEEANSVVIYLEENSSNTLKDGTNYSDYEEDVNSTIYSKDDLIFDGTGILNIIGNYEDGIVCKDDLKIINGTYNIETKDDGIRGKDSLYILNGNFNITSGGDGLKSTNDTDETKGYIKIENGTYNIISNNDGIDAQTYIIIDDGNFTIKTGGGSTNASTKSEWGKWSMTTTLNDSAKGIKSVNSIVINSGIFNLDTSDDSIHSNNYVSILSGDFTITSGDDGIHADSSLLIENGNINITKSYEGIESSKIVINNGNIKIVSSDDGINAGGGNDSSSMNRPGANNFSNSNNTLTINGGNIYVNASGDGLDANGSIFLNGGYVSVDGSSDNGNGALDYDSVFEVTGGTLIAVGANGMAQGISSSSTQYGVLINLSTSFSKDSTILITDSKGNEILSYKTSKSFSSITFTSSDLKKGETYNLSINGDLSTTFTISSISTTIGNSGMGGMTGNRGPKR